MQLELTAGVLVTVEGHQEDMTNIRVCNLVLFNNFGFELDA